jgi:predicted nucleic acid-binding protein
MRRGNPIVVDACVLINLAATGQLDAIARVLGLSLLVTEPARAEVGNLRNDVDGIAELVPIRLEPHISSGSLTVTPLKPEELSMYVELALEVGDGEAASIAAAANRGLSIATDDRKARRMSVEHGLSEPVRTTAILRGYCEALPSQASFARDLLWSVKQRANYVPPRSDPDHDWWWKHLGR